MIGRILLVLSLLFGSAAQAQQTQSALNTLITNSFPDNSVGFITPLLARTVTNSIVNSYLQSGSSCSGATLSPLQDYFNTTSTTATTRSVYDSVTGTCLPFMLLNQTAGAVGFNITNTQASIGTGYVPLFLGSATLGGTAPGSANISFLNGLIFPNYNVAGGTVGNIAANGTQAIINGSSAQCCSTGGGFFTYVADVQFDADKGTTNQSNYSALLMRGLVNATPTGTDFIMDGGNCNVQSGPSVTFPVGGTVECFEADVTISDASAALPAKEAFNIVLGGTDAAQGTDHDAAINVTTSGSNAVTPGWKNFANLDFRNGQTIGTAGCVICAMTSAGSPAGASPSVATGIDLSPLTLTTAYKSNGFRVDGSGNIIALAGIFSGRIAANANLGGTTIPAGDVVIGNNFSNGSGEGDFINGITTATNSFYFYQLTSTTAGTLLATLTTTAFTEKLTTAATSTTTGAIVDAGGLGVAGAAYIGGLLNVAGTITAADSGTWSSGGINGSIIGGTTAAAITGTAINATTGFKANGTSGVASQTCTVNQAKTLIFTFGILTGGSCNT